MFDKISQAMENWVTILEPDENTPEWWAGAPSVVRDDDGTFYMAVRMREGKSPRGKRGYEVRILRSEDGRKFETINQIKRDDAGIPGFERPALVKDPASSDFMLFGCSGLEKEGWSIIRFADAKNPADFKATPWDIVATTGEQSGPEARLCGYKDPFIFHDGTQWHMTVIGHDWVERAYHFTSPDARNWTRDTAPLMDNNGWHNFYTRPASVLSLDVGYLLIYEGSNNLWPDPVYNIATGLAYSADLTSCVDLTPDEPLLKSTTSGEFHTWRYSHWLRVGNDIYVYFEAARPNRTNEIRLAILPSMR
jgi:hypothetical protein